MANKPNNPALWSRAKSLAKQKFDVYPSAYANGWAAKYYKSKGGTWRKAEFGMEILEEGGTNNPGFKALPEYVQAKILANMGYGGMTYPFMQAGGDPDGAMALGQIDAAMDKLQKLRQFIQPDSDLEPWVSSKLTLMDHYTDAVSDYMMYNPEAQGEMMEEPEGLPMQEMKEGGIPTRYRNMGFTKVGVKKNSTRPGKKWMVLAKKGNDYKVVHGGYDGMKDYTQHHNEGRRERFWDRMGGKNSAKAKDPFSPLYWHKRFGTWEDGGEIMEMREGGYIGHDGEFHKATTPTWSGNVGYEMGGYIPEYGMGGMPCYECGGMFAYGGIHIDPAKKGTFKAQATRMGMSTQEAAAHILSNREDYSPAMVKKANFARNFAKEEGGPVEGDVLDVTPEKLEELRAQGYEFEII